MPATAAAIVYFTSEGIPKEIGHRLKYITCYEEGRGGDREKIGKILYNGNAIIARHGIAVVGKRWGAVKGCGGGGLRSMSMALPSVLRKFSVAGDDQLLTSITLSTIIINIIVIVVVVVRRYPIAVPGPRFASNYKCIVHEPPSPTKKDRKIYAGYNYTTAVNDK